MPDTAPLMARKSFQFPCLPSVAFLLACLTGLPPARAQAPSPYTPYELRALFLFNFAKYTEWPKDALPEGEPSFVLGVLGKDPFGKDLDIIKGKPIKKRTLVVKYFKTAEEVEGCQILFISSSEHPNLPHILKTLEGASILTVAEHEGFLQQHGMVNLIAERKGAGRESVDFEINRAAAEKARLKLDTQLLKLARNVVEH